MPTVTAKAPPSGPGWLHEIKHDGFRIMARRDSAGVRLITRHGPKAWPEDREQRARIIGDWLQDRGALPSLMPI